MRKVDMGFYEADVMSGEELKAKLSDQFGDYEDEIKKIDDKLEYAVLDYNTDRHPNRFYKEIDRDRNVYGDAQLINCNIENSIIVCNTVISSDIKNSIILCGADSITESNINLSFIKNSSIIKSKINLSIIGNSYIDSNIDSGNYNEVIYESNKLTKHSNVHITSLNLGGFQSNPNTKRFLQIILRNFDPYVVLFQESCKHSEYTKDSNVIYIKGDNNFKHYPRNYGSFMWGDVEIYNTHAKANDSKNDEFNPSLKELLSKFVIVGDFNRNQSLLKMKKLCDKSTHLNRDDKDLDNIISTVDCEFNTLKIPYLDKRNHKLAIVTFTRNDTVYEEQEKSCDDCVYNSDCPEEKVGLRPNAEDCVHYNRCDFGSDLDSIKR